MACELFAKWPHTVHVSEPPTSTNSAWRSRKVWVAIPEDLKQLLPHARALAPGLAGVIILDPNCIMYKAAAELTTGATDIAMTAPSTSSTSGLPRRMDGNHRCCC